MTKERLTEITNYYKVSFEFLEKILENVPETATSNDIEKVNTTISLFKDTYSILVEYSEYKENQ